MMGWFSEWLDNWHAVHDLPEPNGYPLGRPVYEVACGCGYPEIPWHQADNHECMFHNSTACLDCAPAEPEVTEAEWIECGIAELEWHANAR